MQVYGVNGTQYVPKFAGLNSTKKSENSQQSGKKNGCSTLAQVLRNLATLGASQVKPVTSKPVEQPKEKQYWQSPGIFVKESTNEDGDKVKKTIIGSEVVDTEVTRKNPDGTTLVSSYKQNGQLTHTIEKTPNGDYVAKYYANGNVSSTNIREKTQEGNTVEKRYNKNNELVTTIIKKPTADGWEKETTNRDGVLISKSVMTETQDGDVSVEELKYYDKNGDLTGEEITTSYPDGVKTVETISYIADRIRQKVSEFPMPDGSTKTVSVNKYNYQGVIITSADKSTIVKESYDDKRNLINKSEYKPDGTSIDYKYTVANGKSVLKSSITNTPDGKTIYKDYDSFGSVKSVVVRYETEDGKLICEEYDNKKQLKKKEITTKEDITIETYGQNGELVSIRTVSFQK